MGAARFQIKKRIKALREKDFEPTSMGGILDKTYWGVHREYWITKFSFDDEEPHDVITHRSGFTKQYCPLTDHPDLFLQFCTVGKPEAAGTADILQFVSRYGLLFDVEEEGTQYYYQGGMGPDEIFAYAKEANFTHEIYGALVSKRADKLRQTYNSFNSWACDCNWIPTRYDGFSLLQIAGEEVASRWNRLLPEQYRGYSNAISPAVRDFEPDDYFQALNALGEWALNGAPDQVLYSISGQVICRVMSERLDKITPATTLRADNEGAQPLQFEPSWKLSSLLSAIWLLFYLKITGQMDKKYKVCPECNNLIENPRKNQTYHDNCRKAAHIRNRRLAEKMWKGGQSIDAIVEATGTKLETVKGWIEKLSL